MFNSDRCVFSLTRICLKPSHLYSFISSLFILCISDHIHYM